MINSVSSINNITASNSISTVSSFSVYKQAQDAMSSVAQLVFQSLSMLTASSSGISKTALPNFKTLLDNENMTDRNAYKLTGTILNRFSDLSSDGDVITEDDFTAAVKYSFAQNLTQTSDLNRLINEGKLNISSDIADLYGYETAQTIAIVQFLDTLSEETLGSLMSEIKNAQAKSSVKPDSYYGNTNNIQDYKTVTADQLRGRINIAV